MEPMEIAEAVRAACLRAAAGAYEDAGLQGLCAEGRQEAALGAIRALDLSQVVEDLRGGGAPGPQRTWCDPVARDEPSR